MTVSKEEFKQFSGCVESVIFHNLENGFCVLKAKITEPKDDTIKIIGYASKITAGEFIECSGTWENDLKHGQQFKAEELKVVPPSTIEGIKKYLESGVLQGVRKGYAAKLVKEFGKDVFNVIEHTPERLKSIKGLVLCQAKNLGLNNTIATLHRC